MNPMRSSNSRRWIGLAVVVGIATFVIGILIGRFATCPETKQEERRGVYLEGVPEGLVENGDPTIGELLRNNMRSENIRENLRMLSNKPHLGGTEPNHELARIIKERWEKVGIHVTQTPYHVLLSYPDMSDLNYVELLNEKNGSVYKSDLREPILTPEENKTGIVPPFNAYSAPGDIYGDLVYVNYGRVEDYEFLENNKSINISGKIAFARYGKIYRGDKVHFAELRGAIAVILFSDPEDVTDGDINQVYPKDWWLPPSGTQRGTLYIGDGDPLTADYPSTETAYRELDPQNYLPKIPCHPIGYGIAIELMRQLGGEAVPATWQGGMDVTYRFGNGFNTTGWRAHVKVSTANSNVTTYNVIGIIRGSIEPDRYVLIGNHRDAWVFGALDPSSGTAIMMEMARVMGELVQSGRWRPRRSIVFCSWGAEEYGLIGSTEWVEHYVKSLGSRAVAYLNVDIAVEGNYSLEIEGTPMLHSSVIRASRLVANPNAAQVAAGKPYVYDTWVATFPSKWTGRPQINLPGAGSDYAPFRDRLGIPVLDMRFTWDRRFKVSSYPMYHSAYETFYLVDQISDKGFKVHTALGQIWTEIAREVTDSLILPFNLSDYALVLEYFGETLLNNFGKVLTDKGLQTDLLQTAITNFTSAVKDFEAGVKTANLKNPFVVRQINDQLMQLDRAFLDPAGLPGRRLKRHILFAESTTDSYSGSSFPGLSDALTEIRLGHDPGRQWEIVHKHFSVILFSIQSAASTLKDVTDFMYDY